MLPVKIRAQMHLLSLLVFIPVISSLLILFFPDKNTRLIKVFSAFTCIVQLALAVVLLLHFDADASGFQFTERYDWITLDMGSLGVLSVDYYLGVDGISLPLVLLTPLMTLLAVFSSFQSIKHSQKAYYAIFLLLSGMITGCFLALDFFLFYLFFEFMLLPMYFLIGIWGGPRKDYASIKFFIYTLMGSVLILVVMVGLYLSVAENTGMGSTEAVVHTFRIDLMAQASHYIDGTLFHPQSAYSVWGIPVRHWGFLLIFFGFAVKLPAVPFHTWLPDAHVEAPTPVSVMLAALLLKTGGYGLFRIAYNIFPQAALQYAEMVAILGMVSILYGAFMALAAKDLKKMIAYSSVSHMGFIMLGLASGTVEGANGAVFQMVSHGLLSGMLFLISGVIYDRTGDRMIANYSGLAQQMPYFTAVVVIGFFASLGLPGFSNFIGEIFVFLGAFKSDLSAWIVLLSVLGLVLSAAYFLWTLQKMFFGSYWTLGGNKWEKALQDLSNREKLIMLPLIILTIMLGIFPALIFDLSAESVNHFINHVLTYKGVGN